jgi:hypothetical protein
MSRAIKHTAAKAIRPAATSIRTQGRSGRGRLVIEAYLTGAHCQAFASARLNNSAADKCREAGLFVRYWQ